MDYRKEIDGLRSIAVVPVIFFHAGFSIVSGGYVGVDVFFVISGYLITSLLIADLEAGQFSIGHFYERRIRRIVPALLFVILVTTVFSVYYMIPDQVKDYYGSLVSVAGFVSNFYFAADAGYFGAAPLEKPLLHTWSLSVEEQFYVLFPVLMMLGWQHGRARVVRWITVVAIISLIIAELSHRLLDPEVAYYLTPGRAWELMLGSLIAFHGDTLVNRSRYWIRESAALAGLVMIGLAVVLFDEHTPSPSLYTLMPTAGAALILVYARRDTLTGRLLGSWPLVAVGLVSYSAYLWHQPLFAIGRLLGVFEPNSPLFAKLALISIGMGAVSYLLIERPFRKKTRFQRRTIFIFGAVALLIVIGIGLVGLIYQPAAHHSLLRNWKKKQMESYALFVRNPELTATLTSFGKEPGRRVLVIGDSHAKDMFNVLYQYRDEFKGRFVFRSPAYGLDCIRRYGANGDAGENCDLAKMSPTLFQEAEVLLVSVRWDESAAKAAGAFIEFYRKRGKQVVIAGRTVEYPNAPTVLHKLFWANQMQPPPDATIRSAFWANRLPEVAPINDILRSVTRQHHAVYLDKWDYGCEVEKKECFALDEDGYPLHYDYGHYTVEGVKFFGRRVVQIDWLRPIESDRQR
jgi:peptidoglycan/LPS O-acetylase OafA/YrhL